MRQFVAVFGFWFVAACGASSGGREGGRDERSVPLELYRSSVGRVDAFSASGKTVVVSRPSTSSPYDQYADIALVERSTERVLASIKGAAVGQPGDSEAYALVDQKLVAMVSKREVPLEMPAAMARYHWRLFWSMVDHGAGTALLVFDQEPEVGVGLPGDNDADRDRRASRFELVEVDTNAMALRGHATISQLGSRMTADEVAAAIVAVETENGTRKRVYGSAPRGCAFAASGAQVFVTCRKPEARRDVEHWVSTRYDGLAVGWSIEFETPPGAGGGDVDAAVTGDGKTLVIAHGDRSYGVLDAHTTILVDTASGKVRSIARPTAPGDLGRISEVVPVPGTSLVAQIHRFEPSAHSWGSPSFHGISVVDGATGAIRIVLDTTSKDELRKSIPDEVVVLPNGTYLLAIR